ncbi:class I SAM-dependent methyltransferase [Magnetospirillum sp. UT-4]|uniref:class I SAM-dependent methyltransferase n=1 Tax=Magnetospirillum sp. UT-4 TaxID=2681467 RepID=UPI00137E4396|nr:class I SAM-dependent methyltransferase [Magnetospirillum sp. UT-4]CAA7612123.1 putative methyltransferase protein [Magnetospirillum sp. UT-4]
MTPYPSGLPELPTLAVPTCPVCTGANRHPVATGLDYELQTCANQWHFVRCGDCGCVWLDPRPAAACLSAIYPPTYYSYDFEKRISAVARFGKSILDARKFGGVFASLDAPPGSYLDIGCGDGRYLRLMADRGVPRQRIVGLELSAEPVARLRQEGFQAFHRRVEDCTEIADGTIDLATMFHVIEHVSDPFETLRTISRWLSPGGVLVIETPNTDSLDFRLFSTGLWGGYHIPRHWTLFDSRSLERLLRRCGLEPVATSFQTGHSFWMYSFHHLLRYRFGLRSLSRLFDPLERAGLPMLMGFTVFDILRRNLGASTSAILAVARKPAAGVPSP